MARGSADMAGENAANTPDDPEAAGKSGEQGEKLNQVSSDVASTDQAIAETQTRGEGLVAEAGRGNRDQHRDGREARAGRRNLCSNRRAPHGACGQTAEARDTIETAASGPARMQEHATLIDGRGQALVDESSALEQTLHAIQLEFAAAMGGVPGHAPRAQGGEPIVVQRQPEEAHGYEDRYHFDLLGSLGAGGTSRLILTGSAGETEGAAYETYARGP